MEMNVVNVLTQDTATEYEIEKRTKYIDPSTKHQIRESESRFGINITEYCHAQDEILHYHPLPSRL